MGLKIQVIKCGRCGKPRGLTHTCITRLDRNTKPGKTKIKPRVTATCRRCGKPYTNPLTHVCKNRTDFKKRKAAAERQRRKAEAAAKRKAAAQRRTAAKTPAAAPKPAHDYHQCRDPHCRRHACLAWKEALAEGRASGLEEGYEQGYQAGRSARPHH